ncbi:S-layer homology domain-containing protein [Paenibacillus radicis (ex Xue et al. 2023)]|uniref:S-layer homology domain-containing protein n=1 Tax=Paenibacillus radicis (ex Xue et al. 2023) TaxID=2972489 RepID=A0ABT1YGS9_9BACL|nr:S-layer homology domain-containing protein [Paenibacillus radicis (ex Xue et al. 2023)]MCR8632403.1 S-layer homology domain-containing protein [Paenibacillus radicis (ex Xue et al. 2023)]
MKKKVMASTLSASLVIGSIMGLPLSSSGVLEKVGISKAYAATPGLENITNELVNIHSFLWSEDEKAPIRAVRDNLAGLTDVSLVSEITDAIDVKIGSNTNTYDKLTHANILKLFSSLGLFFNTSSTELTNALNDPEIRAILGQLAQLSGTTLDALSVQDAADFALAVNAAISAQLGAKSFVELGLIATSQQLMKEEIKTAITTVVAGNNKLSVVFRNLDIQAGDVSAVASKIMDVADDAQRSGTTMIALALLRSKVVVAQTGEYPSNSRSQAYTVTVLGKTMPDVLTLITDVSTGTVKYESGRIVLSMTANGTQTGQITGTINAPTTRLDGKLLFKKNVSLSYFVSNSGGSSNNSGSSPNGGGPAPSTGSGSEGNKAISDLKSAIENATGAAKDQLLQQAKAATEDAISKIAKIDVSSVVTVADDKAIAKLDVTALVKQISDINAEVKKLTDALKELDPNAPKAKVELSFDFGSISASKIELPVAKEILDAAKSNGADRIGLKFNGLTVSLAPSAFTATTSLNIEKKAVTEATDVTKLPVASDVYEINFTSNGAPLNNLSVPVELSLPVGDVSKFDVEKLTLAKIIDGKLQIFVGKYNAKDNQLQAKRSSFSTYTVVENNVVFNDTASVKEWAGRQIEVAAAKGILEGRAAGEFVPNGTVTRAEFAKLIVNTFGLENPTATESFDDVNDSDWFKPYVAAAVKSGLVNGRTDTKFDPNGKITRAEMATIAARALTSVNQLNPVSDVNGALKGFSDASSINESLKAGVALSAAQGIIVGEADGTFNPNSDSTRAQAAVIIYRLLNK